MANECILWKYGVMLAKAEATYGTDPTPAITADEVLVWDVQFEDAVEVSEPEYFRPFADALNSTAGSKLANISFKHALVGCGVSTDLLDPRFEPLWAACKLNQTADSGPVTTRTWTPKTIMWEGATIYLYRPSAAGTSGNLYVITGFQGTWKLTLDANAEAFGVIEISGQGLYTVIAEAAIVVPTYIEQTPPAARGTTITLDSKALDFQRVSVEFPIDIGGMASIGPATTHGYSGFYGHPKPVQWEIDTLGLVEGSDTLPEYQFRAKRDAQTELAFAITATIGTVAGNRWALSMPTVVIKEIAESDQDGKMMYSLKGTAHGSDSSFSLALT